MPLRILGALTFGFNPSACLLDGGELVAFAEEERFNRIKTAFNYFPIDAIKFCLRTAKLSLEDVDVLAIPWDCSKYPAFMRDFFEEGTRKFGDKGASTRAWEQLMLSTFDPERFEKRVIDSLRKGGFYGRLPEIVYVPHHLSHAASAFFPSPFEEAAVLTIDGSGEEKCSVVWRARGTEIEPLAEYAIPDSLGWYYSAFTQMLGFKPNMDEGKLMGLAPYGRPRAEYARKLERVVRLDDGRYAVDPSFTFYGEHQIGKGFASRIVKEFGVLREPGAPITDDHRDLAFAVQARLEQAAVMLAGSAMSLTQSTNLCLAGGVCLNCKMNGEVFTASGAKQIFIQPISSDAGSPIGAALWLHRERTGQRPSFRMEHAHFGPGFGNEEIERALRGAKLRYTRHECIEETAADLLADGKILGWFQGSMEAGPRALGGRSILADPTRAEMKDKINAEVKHREPWRPFCPSVAAEDADRFFVDSCDAPFMILARQVMPEVVEQIPAVVHVDGSARPQTVSSSVNPRYWRLLKHFEAQQGVPVLLNTSFNIQGEPIVCTPVEAIRTFYSTGLDALVIGDFLVTK
jgi:carbamoyltransferase